MRYPNLRYGRLAEFQHYAQRYSPADLARRLRRADRCVHDWLSGRARIPWWAPEIMRLQHYEWDNYRWLMRMTSSDQKRNWKACKEYALANPVPANDPICGPFPVEQLELGILAPLDPCAM